MRLQQENKELESILKLCTRKIKDLEQQPEIEHQWRRKLDPIDVSEKQKENKPTNNPYEEQEDDILDLQRLANLKLSGLRREDPQSQPTVQPTIKEKPQPKRFICNKCGQDHNTSEELEDHLDIHCDDGDFTYDTCLFQCNRIKLLKDHLMNSPGHTSGQVRGISAQKCNICDENFISRKDLTTHITKIHQSYKPCRDF